YRLRNHGGRKRRAGADGNRKAAARSHFDGYPVTDHGRLRSDAPHQGRRFATRNTDSSFARERPQSNRKSFSATPASMESGSLEPAFASGVASPMSEKATTINDVGDPSAGCLQTGRRASSPSRSLTRRDFVHGGVAAGVTAYVLPTSV